MEHLFGAGFASGQEIYLFFYRFGKFGLLGIFAFSIILGYIIYKTLKIIYKNKINTYEDFLIHIFQNKKILIKINNILVNLFLCLTFFIMIAGFGTYLFQEFGINKLIGSTIISILTFIAFLRKMKGITKVNSVIVPILIILIFILGIKNIFKLDLNQIGANLTNEESNIYGIIQAIIYASYNLILLIPVIINLKKFIKSKKQIKITSIITALILGIMATFTFLILTNVKTDFSKIEMPVVYVIQNKFAEFKTIYGIIILVAIFTTAISLGISFLNNICKDEEKLPKYSFVFCTAGLIVSQIGFSNLVKILFPLFGYLGLLQIYFIVKSK